MIEQQKDDIISKIIMGINGVWLFPPPTACPLHVCALVDEPPYELSTPQIFHPMNCHRWSNSVATNFVTVRPPWDGIERTPSGPKSKCLTPCAIHAIHACELDPFPAETIEMAGAQALGQPNTGSVSATGLH